MIIKEVKVLPHQRQFIESTTTSTGLVAGYGSGKSYAGVMKALIRKLQYPASVVVYYLPTYPLIQDICFDIFPKRCNDLDLHYQLNKSDKTIEINGFGKVLFRNMSEPETIIGYESHFAIIDECDILPKKKMDDAFKHILARNRGALPKGVYNTVDVVGTPNGFRWFYDRFVTNAKPNYKLIRAATKSNPYLPPDYIDKLKEDYDELLLKQYLNGDFVNINSSSVYHQFDRKIHVIDDIEIDISKPLVITWDFNINPYNAVFLTQIIDNKIIVIDNAILKNAPVVDTLAFIKKKFKKLGNYLYSATIYGDATGKARSQGTAQSNYDLIRDAGWIKLEIKTSNPRVTDRINVTNSLLKNGLGETKLFVCKRNKELIQDFEQMSYNGKGEMDKSDLELSHSSDSVGYYLEYEHGFFKAKALRANY